MCEIPSNGIVAKEFAERPEPSPLLSVPRTLASNVRPI
jgi:hypothetical protein